MKVSQLGNASALIESLDHITTDIKALATTTETYVMVRHLGKPFLKCRASISVYLDFLSNRKIEIEKMLTSMGVDTTG